MASGRTGHATYYLDLNLVSQSQAGNYSTVSVHGYTIADSGWTGFSNSPIGWSVSTGQSGAVTFSGSNIEWFNFVVNIGHDANGYSSGTISASFAGTGTTTFGGPIGLSQGFNLPRIPKVPGPPSIAVSVAGTSATVHLGSPGDNGGSAITDYVIQYSLNGGPWDGTTHAFLTTYTALSPGSYVFRGYAVNGVGAGYTASSPAYIIKSGGKVYSGGSMHAATTRVRSGGVWHDAILKGRSSGAWKDPS